MARGQPERHRLPGWGCVPCRCEKALDWDLYFCGRYGKIGKQLFDIELLLISGQHARPECPADRRGQRGALRGAEWAGNVPGNKERRCGQLTAAKRLAALCGGPNALPARMELEDGRPVLSKPSVCGVCLG